MTDQQVNYLNVLTSMACTDTQHAEDAPTCTTKRSIALWTIQQLEDIIDELPLTPESQSCTRTTVKDLRTRITKLPRRRSSEAA